MKTLGYALGFKHSHQDLANVNEWKITFDPYLVKFQNGFAEGYLNDVMLGGIQLNGVPASGFVGFGTSGFGLADFDYIKLS